MRLVTWNVAGRVRRLPEQAEVVAAVGADVVALQEVTRRTLPDWLAALRAAGYEYCATAVDLAPPERRRPLGVLTAAREPLEALPQPDVPWPERILCCAVDGVEVINLHSPIAPAPDLAKIRTHEAVGAYLTAGSRMPRVLCGDLNTPRREHEDGSVLTFAHDSGGRLRPERGERWDAAERALVHTLRDGTGGSTPTASSTDSATARRAGPSRRTAAAGGSTTCWSRGSPRRGRLRPRVAPRGAERPFRLVVDLTS